MDQQFLEVVVRDKQFDTFWRNVDGVLVVNLDSRPDRWQEFLATVANFIPANKLHRLSATLGAALPGFGSPPLFKGKKRDKTWAGRAGCTLSHRSAIESAKRNNWHLVLILEDDIELTPELCSVLAHPSLLESDWDVCYLGFTDPVAPFRTLCDLPAGHSLCRVNGCSTTHAYLLKDTTYDLLLEKLPTADTIWRWISRHRAIDRWYYRNLSRHFVVSAVTPSLINQLGGFSDITQRRHEILHSTQLPAKRHGNLSFPLLRAWRRVSYMLAEPRDWLRGRIKQFRGF